jgi:uncharacterized protein HemY
VVVVEAGAMAVVVVVVVVVVVAVAVYSVSFTTSRVFGTVFHMKNYEGSLKATYIYKDSYKLHE